MLPFNFLTASHGCDFVVEEVRDFHSADSMELGVFANPNDKIVLGVAFPRWIGVGEIRGISRPPPSWLHSSSWSLARTVQSQAHKIWLWYFLPSWILQLKQTRWTNTASSNSHVFDGVILRCILSVHYVQLGNFKTLFTMDYSFLNFTVLTMVNS